MESQNTEKTKRPIIRALISFQLKDKKRVHSPATMTTELVEDVEEWYKKYVGDDQVEFTLLHSIVLESNRDLLEELIKKWD